MSIVVIDNVCKSFGAVPVLNGVSLSVDRGQAVAIIGRSGSGKSTLLRCLNGLERIQSGRIEIAGEVVGHDPRKLIALRKKIGIVFQSYNLFPHMTVGENIILAPHRAKGVPRPEATDIARKVLDQVGLGAKFDAYPDTLSGGQQQRVAIARALAMKPEVMLFDEVTSALDPELTEEVLLVIEDLAKQGMTMLLVTHEMGFARRVADTTVFMHQGKVWESGPSKQLFAEPATAELKSFVRANLL